MTVDMNIIEGAASVLEPNREELLPLVLEAIPDHIELVYVSQGDQLMKEQIVKLLAGEPEWEDSNFDEWVSECSMQSSSDYIDEIQKDLGLADWQMGLVRDDLQQALWDRDKATPLKDLLRGTPSRWLRFWLDERDLDSDELIDRLVNPGVPGVAEVLSALGLLDTDQHTPELEDEIAEVLVNSGTEVAIYILWHDDLDKYIEAASYEEGWKDQPNRQRQTITWKDPYLLLYNPFCGNGWADQIHCTVTTSFTKDHLHLDEKGGGGGYSFTDEVCGGWTSDNSTEVTIFRGEEVVG